MATVYKADGTPYSCNRNQVKDLCNSGFFKEKPEARPKITKKVIGVKASDVKK